MSNLRDQRLEVFGYSDEGTGGRSAPTYTLASTYWGRHASPSGSERTIAGQASQSVDAVFLFAGEATIPADGAIRTPDGEVFKVTAVLPRRYPSGLKRWQVYGVRADEMELSGT